MNVKKQIAGSARTMRVLPCGHCVGLVLGMHFKFFGFLVLLIVVCAPFKAMKSMSYFYECTHGIEDVGYEIVMVVGVGWGTSVCKGCS